MERSNSWAVAIDRRFVVIGVAVAALGAGCSDSEEPAADAPVETAVSDATAGLPADDARESGWVGDVFTAMDAVEAELGAGQQFFEVTTNSRFTNIFVATDNGSAVVPYTFVDGTLQAPAPKQTGAEGVTFGRNDVDFDPDSVFAGIERELPDSIADAISVYGDGVGATYVVAVTSPSGGFLDVVVDADGQVFSVDPL